ncbi:DUF3025 domain-containing protein [Acidovorax sp. FG27]|uniref:DUF3025 domain-containing protein n=1 Tax=Acidovorax sp. FG27 TaxID=3133652 RepID=UPI0030E9AE83
MKGSVFAAAAPWLSPYVDLGSQVERRWQHAGCLWDALNGSQAQSLAGVRFVASSALPAGTAYEQFIHATRTVPTRDNLHDFFNGLVWLHYPQTKRLLNDWQARAIASQGIGAVRGPLRDAITVFDENGAVLFAPAALREALRERAWRRLFVDLRPLWAEATLLLFGHALLEKLVQPRKPITAHVHCAGDAIESVASADAWLAQSLDAEVFAGKPFNPLPVLGMPGWWPENENFCFYDDSHVFRSRRPA